MISTVNWVVSKGLSGEVAFNCVKISGRASKQRKGPRQKWFYTQESQNGQSGVNKDESCRDGVHETGRGQIMKGFTILVRSWILSVMASCRKRWHVFKKST